LAASIELGYGDRTLKDPGAVRDLIASLAEGVAAHVAAVRRRVPGAAMLLQLDEPGLPAALAGSVRTASGFGRLAAVEEQDAEDGLREVIERAAGAAATIVHCCAPDVPYAVLRRAGAGAVSVDLGLMPERADDAVGETIDAGVGLFLGVVPGMDTRLPDLKATAAPVRELWRRLGFAAERLPDQVVLTPACGLAGASPGYVRTALARCREAARMLYETAG
jgi:methionine synthase II (cobalamin-independent)